MFSCAQEQSDTEFFDTAPIQQRSVNDIELQFSSNLLDMINLYEESNIDSDGSLAELLNEIYDLPQEEAELMLSNSGLIDMNQLNSLILESENLEEQLENFY